ncbi:uncharacterized protein ACN63O_005621 [Diretmus argenteus]
MPMLFLPADTSKMMQSKKKRLDFLTKNYMEGSQQKLEQSSARQQWETEAQRAEDQEEQTFLQGAQQELKKDMASLQKKILADMKQQEMAGVRESLQSMLF